MSDRIVTPIDPVAFAAAQHAFEQKYGIGVVLVPGTKDHRKKRAEWLRLYRQAGGRVDSGKTFQGRDAGGHVEPCPLKNEIESVEFLDGGAAPMAANSLQYVNLPREQKFVDGVRVASLDRLGRTLRARVKFRRPKVEKFKVMLLAHSGNATYTPTEKGARACYDYNRTAAAPAHVSGAFDRYQNAVYTGQTRKDGVAIIEGSFTVTAAGGDRYSLVAWDVNGNVVHAAHTLTTKRMLYYATFLADDPNHVRVNQAWFRGQFEAEYALHHVEMVWLGEEQMNGVVYHDTLMSLTVGDRVRSLAATAQSSANRTYAADAPYVVKFAFVDHCAQADKKHVQAVRVDGASPGDVIDVPIYVHTPLQRQADPHFDWRKCLWLGLGAPLDTHVSTTTGHEWFESASLTEHRPAGDVVTALADTDFTLVARNVGAPNAMCQVQYTVPPTVPPNTDVTINLQVLIMSRSVLGQSLVGAHAGITLQPGRHNYKDVPANNQLASALHECGHAIGMVARAAQQGVTHDRQYEHNGSHCWESVAGPAATPDLYHQIPLKDTGTCVMYGLIPDAAPNMHFCARCGAVLKRLDLSQGYTG